MQELFGGRRCTCRRIACRCQSTLAADVAAHEVFPPARPQERTAKPQGGWVGETCPSGAALAAEVRWHREGRGGWGFSCSGPQAAEVHWKRKEVL
jgi:hypothetical protein